MEESGFDWCPHAMSYHVVHDNRSTRCSSVPIEIKLSGAGVRVGAQELLLVEWQAVNPFVNVVKIVGIGVLKDNNKRLKMIRLGQQHIRRAKAQGNENKCWHQPDSQK